MKEIIKEWWLFCVLQFVLTMILFYLTEIKARKREKEVQGGDKGGGE